jgi:hypothetical protein
MLLDSDGNGLSVGFTRGAAIILITTNWIIIWRSLGARQTRRIPGGLDWKRGFFAVYLCFYLCCGVRPLAAQTMFLNVPFSQQTLAHESVRGVQS